MAERIISMVLSALCIGWLALLGLSDFDQIQRATRAAEQRKREKKRRPKRRRN